MEPASQPPDWLVPHTGYISSEYTVWCNRCCRWYQVSIPTKAEAITRFRRNGWKCTKWGWQCPECVQELKEGKTEVGYRRPEE